jgi:hypothetical protein
MDVVYSVKKAVVSQPPPRNQLEERRSSIAVQNLSTPLHDVTGRKVIYLLTLCFVAFLSHTASHAISYTSLRRYRLHAAFISLSCDVIC